MLILRNSPTPIDWSEFLRCTTDFRVSVLATHALTYLREEFDAPIPTTVLDPLRNQSPEPWEFAEFHHITHHPPSLHPVWLWHRHQRQFALHPDPEAPHKIPSYLDFLRIRWDLPNRWHLPASFLQRTISYFFGTAS